MPLANAAAVVMQFRRQVLAADRVAANALVEAYAPIWKGMRHDLDALLQKAKTEQLSVAQTMETERLRALNAQVEAEVKRFNGVAAGTIGKGQLVAVGIAHDGTRQTIEAALPRGVPLSLAEARLGVSWNRVPFEALQSFVGVAGDGKPLGRLLAATGPMVSQGVKATIAEGIVRGYGPIKTAGLVRDRVGMGLTRSLTISRTEILRSYRSASQAQYSANKRLVKGYRRVTTKDERTCLACLALDGELYQTNAPLDEHVNGRCAIVPETVTYADLGLDVKEPTRQYETGPEWFDKQPAEVQRNMFGSDRLYDAYKNGDIDLSDMVKVTPNRTWGPQATEASVNEVLGGTA